MNYFLLFFAYLVGSIPFGLLIGKIRGIDVRKVGSGNIGATNVGRLLGKKYGFLTLFADVGKAVVPMVLTNWLLKGEVSRDFWIALCGAAAFLGHLFPIYLRFKGGKGVATALGIFLFLAPWAVLVDVIIFIGVVYNWGYVSLGSLTAALMMPGLIWLLYGAKSYTFLAIFIGLLVWLKHKENIVRLLHKEEKSWKADQQKEK